jgi:hypothetical protein
MLRALGKFIWRFMVIFSFIVNLVLIIVLIALGVFIFEIKNNVADPLVQGLHRTAVGLDEATIDWTIPVRDSLFVDLQVPINQDTILSTVTEYNDLPVDPISGETLVTLTRDVPLVINNAFIQSPDLTLRNATVNITLPAGTSLPVSLDLEVGLQTDIPVSLDVRAVIPIDETQLTDPIQTLQLLFEPLALGLHNLPSDFNQAGGMVQRVLDGQPINLLALDGTGGINSEPYVDWYGYSVTAGENYPLANSPAPANSVPNRTNIVPLGGIPVLDEQLDWRNILYQNDSTPMLNNTNAINNMLTSGVNPATWNGDGTISPLFALDETTATDITAPTTEQPAESIVPSVGGVNPTSSGIIPTPTTRP